MAYQAINFPAMKLIHGLVTERIAPVTIVSNFAKEYRVNRFSTSKQRFVFAARNMRWSDWQTLQSFFITVKWETDSFNYVNPVDGTTYKVRLSGAPSTQIIALSSSNLPTIVNVGEFALVQVFNE